MIKRIAFFSIISFLISCHEQPTLPDNAALIKGDWVGPMDTTEDRNQTLYASFKDSTCIMPGINLKYHILKDTLYLNNLPDDDQTEPRHTILKLSADSLILLSAHKHDTIKFTKVSAKNNITPAAIYFTSSGCFGTCPIQAFEIDSSLNFLFYGERYTNQTGGYRGKLSRSEYEYLLNQVRNLPLSSLQEYYEAPWTDDQTLGVTITYKDTAVQSVAYGHFKEPMELHILFRNLLKIYEAVPLHADSSVTSEYFLTHPPQKTFTHGLFAPPKVLPPNMTPPKIVK
jgi:hypothetical protein